MKPLAGLPPPGTAINERTSFVRLLTLTLIILIPDICFAEVLHHEPTLAAIWSASAALAFLGYGLSRYRLWAGALAWMLACLVVGSHFAELLDPQIGPLIRQIAGPNYIIQSYVAGAIALIVPILGLIQTLSRRNR